VSSAIRGKGELLIHLEPLGLPELEQAALGLRVNGLDKAKAPTRGTSSSSSRVKARILLPR